MSNSTTIEKSSSKEEENSDLDYDKNRLLSRGLYLWLSSTDDDNSIID